MCVCVCVCVCVVLCMDVNEIISASKRWHGLLSSLDNSRKIYACLTSNLTHLQGWNKGRKERKKKKGRESVNDTVIKILCSTSMERMCMYII